MPDYVFKEDYPLMSLEDLREYVAREQHLPNVPSEADIKAYGLNHGEFQMSLLEKVEELTLYTLQQQQQIAQLQTLLGGQGIEGIRVPGQLAGNFGSEVRMLMLVYTSGIASALMIVLFGGWYVRRQWLKQP